MKVIDCLLSSFYASVSITKVNVRKHKSQISQKYKYYYSLYSKCMEREFEKVHLADENQSSAVSEPHHFMGVVGQHGDMGKRLVKRIS